MRKTQGGAGSNRWAGQDQTVVSFREWRCRVDEDYKSVASNAPKGNQLASNGLYRPTFFWDRTELASFGRISSDAVSKTGMQ